MSALAALAHVIAYSYIRWSSDKQKEGDSLRRQLEDTAAWCKRHKVLLDTRLTFKDEGTSAFRGKNRDLGALGAFLKLVEDGDIRPGSILIVESLDRLSREHVQPALLLILGLLQKGIRVVQLKPVEVVYDAQSEAMSVMMMVMELSRGNSESRMKSDRVGKAWQEKRRRRRNGETQKATQWMGEGCHFMTRRLPAWLEIKKHEIVPIPARAKVIRRLFEMCLEGQGVYKLVGWLQANVTPWGRSSDWSHTYVHLLLTSRAMIGELQPTAIGADGKKAPAGDVIKDYYPQIIPPDLFDRVQDILALRRGRRGPTGKKVATLFGKLLHDARTGGRMYVSHQVRNNRGKPWSRRVLMAAAAMDGRAKVVSFPNDVFEQAVLSLLKEVKPKDILDEPQGEAALFAEKVATKEARQRQVKADLASDDGDYDFLRDQGKRLETEIKELKSQLAVARQKERHPRSASWAEAFTLMDAAQDEKARLKLRDVLQNMVESVWCLVVPHQSQPSHRFCALQIAFAGDGTRHYLIHYQSSGFGRKGGWVARSLDAAGLAATNIDTAGFDLRDKKSAAELATVLEKIDLTKLQ
jgi:DNA invertase Pin-like site-specific DNA recombinase